MTPFRTPHDHARRAALADAAAGIYPDRLEYPSPPPRAEEPAAHPDPEVVR